MSLNHGSHLGPYKFVAKTGEGGMGEVYRARDTKLDRYVALRSLRKRSRMILTASRRPLDQLNSLGLNLTMPDGETACDSFTNFPNRTSRPLWPCVSFRC